MGQKKTIRGYSTKELVEELRRRSAEVESKYMEPGEFLELYEPNSEFIDAMHGPGEVLFIAD